MKVTLKAPAKINLMLDIINRRKDGYHTLWMIMQSVDLCDIVTLETTSDKEIVLSCSNDSLPTDERNIAYKAAAAFFVAAGIENHGISIDIKKNIPTEAGLAGGSTDAAAVIFGLNELYGTSMSAKKLGKIGLKVGADVPFCLQGGTMLAQGVGEDLTKLHDLPDCFIVLAKPDMGVSTGKAYSMFDKYGCEHLDRNSMLKSVSGGNLMSIGNSMANVFEQFIDVHEGAKIKSAMHEGGSVGSCMSGSGPTYFALFDNENKAENCTEELKKFIKDVFLCRPLKHGCEIIE